MSWCNSYHGTHFPGFEQYDHGTLIFRAQDITMTATANITVLCVTKIVNWVLCPFPVHLWLGRDNYRGNPCLHMQEHGFFYTSLEIICCTKCRLNFKHNLHLPHTIIWFNIHFCSFCLTKIRGFLCELACLQYCWYNRVLLGVRHQSIKPSPRVHTRHRLKIRKHINAKYRWYWKMLEVLLSLYSCKTALEWIALIAVIQRAW